LRVLGLGALQGIAAGLVILLLGILELLGGGGVLALAEGDLALALLGERVLPEPGVVALGVGLVGLHPRLGHLGPGLLGVTLPLRLELELALLDLGGLHGLRPGLLELVAHLPEAALRARVVPAP